MEDRPLDEQALVERARKGDMQAYAALIELHQSIAFRTAYLITRNDADATDAIQEAFIRAHSALGRFRRGAPFRPWLLRIVANEAKDRRAAGARYGDLYGVIVRFEVGAEPAADAVYIEIPQTGRADRYRRAA